MTQTNRAPDLAGALAPDQRTVLRALAALDPRGTGRARCTTADLVAEARRLTGDDTIGTRRVAEALHVLRGRSRSLLRAGSPALVLRLGIPPGPERYGLTLLGGLAADTIEAEESST